MAILGTVMPKSLIQQQLYNMNKDYRGNQIWKSAYDAISLQENLALNQAKNVYDSDIAQAYLASQQTYRGIYGSNAFDSSKEYLAESNRENLAKAYESFRQNYASNVANIQSTASESRAAIDTALTQESGYAKQFVDILNSGEYLSWVAENSPDFFGENSTYRQDLIDLGVLTPNADNTGYTETTGNLFSTENGTIDTEGNLTEKGKNLYRFMLSMDAKGEGYSLTNFLMNNKNYDKLSEWLTSQGTNQYGSNYEMVLNDILGIESDDLKYMSGIHSNEFESYNPADKEKLDNLYEAGRIDQETYDKYSQQYEEGSFVNSARNYSLSTTIGKTGDRFTIRFDGEKKWKAGEYVAGSLANDDMQNALNDFYGGKPDNQVITLYKNKLYIYGAGGWREVMSTSKYNVEDAINKYKNI